MANALILKDLLAEMDCSINAFEVAIDIPSSTIAHAIRRDSQLKKETIDKIVRTFPNVSRTFLETGQLPMFVNPKLKAGDNPNISDIQSTNLLNSQSTKNDKDMIIALQARTMENDSIARLEESKARLKDSSTIYELSMKIIDLMDAHIKLMNKITDSGNYPKAMAG